MTIVPSTVQVPGTCTSTTATGSAVCILHTVVLDTGVPGPTRIMTVGYAYLVPGTIKNAFHLTTVISVTATCHNPQRTRTPRKVDGTLYNMDMVMDDRLRRIHRFDTIIDHV